MNRLKYALASSALMFMATPILLLGGVLRILGWALNQLAEPLLYMCDRMLAHSQHFEDQAFKEEPCSPNSYKPRSGRSDLKPPSTE
jgi:hypothetical protein